MRGGHSSGNLRNPCLTMHQPWASLLVYGIKRIEGRSWPAPIRGKVPEESTIKAMEDFYREIYAVNGITDVVLKLLDVLGEELAGWELVPEGVRLEAQTEMCWLCEQPQKLLIPFEMRGYQGVYNLEKKGAIRGLTVVEVPLAVKFPLPNPQDPFSLKPGSISANVHNSRTLKVERSSTLNAAIAGAQAAATQFSKKAQSFQTTSQTVTAKSASTVSLKSDTSEVDKVTSTNFDESSSKGDKTSNVNHQISRRYLPSSGTSRPHACAPSKIFEGAIRGLTPVEVPLQVLPNPQDPVSLKLGSISPNVHQSKKPDLGRSSMLATAGAQSAAVHVSKRAQTSSTSSQYNATNKKVQLSNDQPSSGALRPPPGAPSKHGYEWRKQGETQL